MLPAGSNFAPSSTFGTSGGFGGAGLGFGGLNSNANLLAEVAELRKRQRDMGDRMSALEDTNTNIMHENVISLFFFSSRLD